MNPLALQFRLQRAAVRVAAHNDAKYLQTLNMKALQTQHPKPEGVDPRTYYEQLQTKAKQGPLFSAKTLQFITSLDLELDKAEVQWLGNRVEKKAKVDPTKLRSVLDYIRDVKPDLSKLSWLKACEQSEVWHEQFKGKEETASPYKTHSVILQCGNLVWVDVPAQDLKTEGNLMGHCVGKPNYARAVKSGKMKIFSLRDRADKPHVTVEVSRGRQNHLSHGTRSLLTK